MDAYEALSERYLGRALVPGDGCSEAEIAKAEMRVGIALPAALRTYYLRCGSVSRFNSSHNLLRSLSELTIEDAHLVFMNENQNVVSWGFRLQDLGLDDPIVWQRNNMPSVEWYSEEMTLPQFLDSMFHWYRETGIWAPSAPP